MRVGHVIGEMFSSEFRIINLSLAESYIIPGFGHIGSVLIVGRTHSSSPRDWLTDGIIPRLHLRHDILIIIITPGEVMDDFISL